MMGILESFAQLARVARPQDLFGFVLVSVVIIIAALIYGIYCFYRTRQLGNVPHYKISQAAQGYINLSGSCGYMHGQALTSPLTGRPCVWYHVAVEKRNLVTLKDDNWELISNKTSEDYFTIKDKTGECIIDPKGASVSPTTYLVWYGDSEKPEHRPDKGASMDMVVSDIQAYSNKYRYTEELLHADDYIYATGVFRTAGFDEAKQEAESDARDLLLKWSKDGAALLEQFDKNKDGQFDDQELAEMKEAAYREAIQQKEKESSTKSVHTMGKTKYHARPFILSTVRHTTQLKKLQYRAIASALVFLFCGISLVLVFYWRSTS